MRIGPKFQYTCVMVVGVQILILRNMNIDQVFFFSFKFLFTLAGKRKCIFMQLATLSIQPTQIYFVVKLSLVN